MKRKPFLIKIQLNLILLFILCFNGVYSAYAETTVSELNDGEEFVVDGIYYTVISKEMRTCKTSEGKHSGPGHSYDCWGAHFETKNGGDCVILKSNPMGYKLVEIGRASFTNTGVKTLIIPEGVEKINDLAFASCKDLTTVTIPNTVTSLGKYAFASCTSLTSVIIGNSVTTIGKRAFYYCVGLTSVNIPNSVTSIGSNAFSSCSGLTSVIIPISVKSIDNDAFENCTGLRKSAYPSHLSNPFENGIAISYPVNEGAIVENGVIFNANKTKIYFVPFDVEAFEISKIVKEIDKSAFSGCDRLTTIYFNAENFIGRLSESKLPSNVRNMIVGNNVKKIPDYVFSNCRSLEIVNLSNSVTSIGSNAFSNCSGLTSVNIPNSVISIGSHAFYGCIGLTLVNIPNSVTSIGSNAFSNCSGLTSVNIPNSVTSIGSGAFSDCSGLISVNIPDHVTSIADNIFYGCSGLTSVNIPNSVSSIGSSAFSGCSGLISVNIPNSVTSIADHTFHGCNGLTSVTIPNSVTSIGSCAFYGCSGLTSVTIPNSVTSIGSSAFSGCRALSSVKLPSALTSLGKDVFLDCPLKEVKAPKSIRYSGMYPEFFDLSKSEGVTKIDFRLQPKSYLKVIDNYGKEVSLKEAAEIDNDYTYKWDGNNVSFTSLHPTQRVSFKVFGCTLDGFTSNVDISLRQAEVYADLVVVEASFGYEELVEDYYFYENVGGKRYEQKTIAVPYGNGSKITFYIRGDGFLNSKDISLNYPTPNFSQEDAVATSYTKARLTAKCNLSTGALAAIEWRRNDAPDNVKSKTEVCPVVNGVLMGELRGLKDDVYYKFRPVCELGGRKFYGEWTGFYTGDAGVYFEPEVGTLQATVTSNSVELEGYAFAGTDDVSESGIEYRRVGSAHKSIGVARTNSGWIKVSATSTTFFKVKLDNLAYDSEYEYRTYAVAGSKTYYGTTDAFNTGADMSGIDDIFVTDVEGLKLSLLRNPVEGHPQLIVSGNGELVDCYIHSTAGLLMKSCSVVADGTPQEIEVTLHPGMYIVTVTDGMNRSILRLLVK